MFPVKLTDESRNLKKPSNWNDDVNGPCSDLSICDIQLNDMNYMVSAWMPTEEDLQKINRGGPIYIGINGHSHPVIFVST